MRKNKFDNLLNDLEELIRLKNIKIHELEEEIKRLKRLLEEAYKNRYPINIERR